MLDTVMRGLYALISGRAFQYVRRGTWERGALRCLCNTKTWACGVIRLAFRLLVRFTVAEISVTAARSHDEPLKWR